MINVVYLLDYKVDSKMRFLIAFALIGAAAALPDSVSLPKAPLPAFEENALPNAEPVDLPKAELPADEDNAIPAFEPIDISPAFVSEEVMEVVRLLQLAEMQAEAVKIVDNAEEVFNVLLAYDERPEAVKIVESPEAVSADDFTVHVVDIAENAVPLAEEAFAVHVVDTAEDSPASFDEQLDAGEPEAIKIIKEIPDAVRVVDAPLRGPGKIFDDPRLR